MWAVPGCPWHFRIQWQLSSEEFYPKMLHVDFKPHTLDCETEKSLQHMKSMYSIFKLSHGDLSHFIHLIMRTQTLQLNECCCFVIGHDSTVFLLLYGPGRPILLYPNITLSLLQSHWRFVQLTHIIDIDDNPTWSSSKPLGLHYI